MTGRERLYDLATVLTLLRIDLEPSVTEEAVLEYTLFHDFHAGRYLFGIRMTLAARTDIYTVWVGGKVINSEYATAV
jgi:hypothetical protein